MWLAGNLSRIRVSNDSITNESLGVSDVSLTLISTTTKVYLLPWSTSWWTKSGKDFRFTFIPVDSAGLISWYWIRPHFPTIFDYSERPLPRLFQTTIKISSAQTFSPWSYRPSRQVFKIYIKVYVYEVIGIMTMMFDLQIYIFGENDIPEEFHKTRVGIRIRC